MPHPRQQEIDDFWSEQLGCSLSQFQSEGTFLVINPSIPYTRMELFHRGDTSIVTVPPYMESVGQAIVSQSLESSER